MSLSAAYCKNIMDWKEFPSYDLLWSDPPWGPGMVKLFNTMSRKAGGDISPYSFHDIIHHLAHCAHTAKPTFIEFSVKGHEEVIQMFQSHFHTFTSKTIYPQVNGKPYILLVFNTDYKPPQDLRGFQICDNVISSLKPTVVFDPFAGIGLIAKTVLLAGSSYIGSELNVARFKRLKEIIATYDK